MIQKLLKFYKQKVSIFSYINKQNLWWKVLIFLLLSVAIFFLGSYLNNIFLRILLFIVPYIFIFIVINIEATKTIIKTYNIDSTKFLWNRIDTNKQINEELENYLIENNIISKEKMEYLIELMTDYSSELRIPFYFNKGLILAVLTPLWFQFISWTYSKNISTQDEAIKFILLVLLIILVFGVPVYFIFSELANNDYRKSKKLCNALKEIYLLKYK